MSAATKQAAHTPGPLQFGVTTRESSKDGYSVDVSIVGLNIGTNCVDQRPATLAETWAAVRKANAHDDLLAALKRIERLYLDGSDGMAMAVCASAAIAKAQA